MHRLGHIGSSPNHSIAEEADSAVLSSSLHTDIELSIALPDADESPPVVQVDEIRLRRLLEESRSVPDDGAAINESAERSVEARVAAPAPPAARGNGYSEGPAAGLDGSGPVPASVAARRLKRTVDLVGSVTALAALSPVLATCAAIVRLGSHGPILFRQKRIGRNGRPFLMLKFRTMYVDADPSVHEAYVKRYIAGEVGADAGGGASVFKLVGDKRITPAGGWLRRLSLDELPQLINVLRGDMSLVGPRPPLPYEVEHYRPRDLQRLRASPGITGLWQVSGRNQTTFDEMIDLDLHYIDRWSVWLDLWILWRTIPVVLFPDGH